MGRRGEVGDHLVTGLRACGDGGHFIDDVAQAAVDQHQVAGAKGVAGEEAVDLLGDRRRGAHACSVRLASDAGIALGIARATADGCRQREAVIGGDQG